MAECSGHTKKRLTRNQENRPRKWLNPRLPHRKIDVYLTKNSDYMEQRSLCEELINSGEPEIYVHGLGIAVTKAINLVLLLKEKYLDTIDVSVNTSSIDCVDECEPGRNERIAEPQPRYNSSVHIRVFRTTPLGAQKC